MLPHDSVGKMQFVIACNNNLCFHWSCSHSCYRQELCFIIWNILCVVCMFWFYAIISQNISSLKIILEGYRIYSDLNNNILNRFSFGISNLILTLLPSKYLTFQLWQITVNDSSQSFSPMIEWSIKYFDVDKLISFLSPNKSWSAYLLWTLTGVHERFHFQHSSLSSKIVL